MWISRIPLSMTRGNYCHVPGGITQRAVKAFEGILRPYSISNGIGEQKESIFKNILWKITAKKNEPIHP
jgi:hypothetical protein